MDEINLSTENPQTQPLIEAKPRFNWRDKNYYRILLSGFILVIIYNLLINLVPTFFPSFFSKIFSIPNVAFIIFIFTFYPFLIFGNFGVFSAMILSFIGTKVLLKKKFVSFNFKKTFILLAFIILILNYAFLQMYIAILNYKDHYKNSVDNWNKYESLDYTFSYPKDFQLTTENKTPGALKEVSLIKNRKFEENQSQVFLFGISKVNPDFYQEIQIPSTSSMAEAYANKIYDLNYSGGFRSELPEYRPIMSNFLGRQAWVVESIYKFIGPGGQYDIRQTNGYSSGSDYNYYIDYGGGVYQVRVPEWGDYSFKILNTLKFGNDNNTIIPQPVFTEKIDGQIKLFSTKMDFLSDVNLNFSSDEFIRLYGQHCGRSEYDNEGCTNYLISKDTKFSIEGNDVPQTEIRKIDLSKGEFGSVIEKKYTRAVIEYYSNGVKGNNSYFVAKQIDLFK